MAVALFARHKGADVDTRPLLAPSVSLLFIWMIVPLALTIYLSFQRYDLNYLDQTAFAGFGNCQYLLEDPGLTNATINTIVLVVTVLVVTIISGLLAAVLLDQPVMGAGLARFSSPEGLY